MLLVGLAVAAASIVTGVVLARRGLPAAPPAIADHAAPAPEVSSGGRLAGTTGSLSPATPSPAASQTPQQVSTQAGPRAPSSSPAAVPALPPGPPSGGEETPAPEGVAGTVSPTRSARPALEPSAARLAGVGVFLPSPDGRDTAAAKVRAQVDAGIEQIEAELQHLQAPPDTQLAALSDRVRHLESLSARHPVALAAQASSLRLIERRIAAGLAESRATVQVHEVGRVAWQRQIAEIEELIGERSYPEAKRLAKKLAADAAAPPDVADRARELAAQADTALKSIFGGTRFGHEQQQIQKTPPPP